MLGLRQHKKVCEAIEAEYGFVLGHLFAWRANKGGKEHNACQAAALLQGADTGEAPGE